MLHGVLLEHYAKLCQRPSPPLATLDLLTEPLYKLAQELPEVSGRDLKAQLQSLQREFAAFTAAIRSASHSLCYMSSQAFVVEF